MEQVEVPPSGDAIHSWEEDDHLTDEDLDYGRQAEEAGQCEMEDNGAHSGFDYAGLKGTTNDDSYEAEIGPTDLSMAATTFNNSVIKTEQQDSGELVSDSERALNTHLGNTTLPPDGDTKQLEQIECKKEITEDSSLEMDSRHPGKQWYGDEHCGVEAQDGSNEDLHVQSYQNWGNPEDRSRPVSDIQNLSNPYLELQYGRSAVSESVGGSSTNPDLQSEIIAASKLQDGSSTGPDIQSGGDLNPESQNGDGLDPTLQSRSNLDSEVQNRNSFGRETHNDNNVDPLLQSENNVEPESQGESHMHPESQDENHRDENPNADLRSESVKDEEMPSSEDKDNECDADQNVEQQGIKQEPPEEMEEETPEPKESLPKEEKKGKKKKTKKRKREEDGEDDETAEKKAKVDKDEKSDSKRKKKDDEDSEEDDGESEESDEEEEDENKVGTRRKNIRKIITEDKLEAATLDAQKAEMERIARLKEAQLRQREEQISRETLDLLLTAEAAPDDAGLEIKLEPELEPDLQTLLTEEGEVCEEAEEEEEEEEEMLKEIKQEDLEEKETMSLVEHQEEEKIQDVDDATANLQDEKTEDQEEVTKQPEKPAGDVDSDVIALSSSSEEDNNDQENDDDIQEVPMIDESVNGEELREDYSTAGAHSNDEFNMPDALGRVLVNVGHPSSDDDIFLAPQIARAIKAHQIGGVRFLYDNVVESLERFNVTSGFGCILAHSMGLGKTLQVVSFADVFLRHTSAKTVLCIVPINTVQNWVAEFNHWLPDNPYSTTLVHYGEVRPRNFPLHVLNDSHRSFGARAKVIMDWNKEGGVLLMGYEMYRQLHSQKLPSRKRRGRKNQEVINLEEEDQNKKLMEEITKSVTKPGPDLVICDEGHRIKNCHASISKSLKEIRTKRRVVLTGYPLQNNLLEYWCMVDFVRPNYLGTKSEFSNMFERPIQNGQCRDSTPSDVKLMRYRAHVLHSLLEGFVQRRGHSVLQGALPRKEEWVLLLRMTTLQRTLYSEFMEYLQSERSVSNAIKAFAVCCKIWNHPDILYHFLKKRDKEDFDFDLEDMNESAAKNKANPDVKVEPGMVPQPQMPAVPPPQPSYTQFKDRRVDDGHISYDWAFEPFSRYVTGLIENSAKTELAFCILEEGIMIGDKVLLFSQSLSTLNLIEDFLQRQNVPGTREKWARNRNYFRLDGSTTSLEREKLINEFNNNPGIHLFLVSTRAGGLGINLVGANRVIVFDASWNPCHDTQAVCRVYRYGQTKRCFVYRVITDNCLEKRIYDRQINKQGMADRVVDELNPDSILKLSDVSKLLNCNDADPPPATFSANYDKFEDIVLNKLLEKYGDRLTKEPFEHESLLIDRKDKKLSEAEKRMAKRAYELEKQASFGGRGSMFRQAPMPGMSGMYWQQGARGNPYYHQKQRPVANVRPLQMESGGYYPHGQFSTPGMTTHQITIPKDVSIPTNASGSNPVKLKAGETVTVIRSSKGYYLRLNDGRFVAIRLPPGAKGFGGAPLTPSGTTITSVGRSKSHMPPPSMLKKLKPGQKYAVVKDPTSPTGKKVVIVKMGSNNMPYGSRGGIPSINAPTKLTSSVTITPVKNNSGKAKLKHLEAPPPLLPGKPPYPGMSRKASTTPIPFDKMSLEKMLGPRSAPTQHPLMPPRDGDPSMSGVASLTEKLKANPSIDLSTCAPSRPSRPPAGSRRDYMMPRREFANARRQYDNPRRQYGNPFPPQQRSSPSDKELLSKVSELAGKGLQITKSSLPEGEEETPRSGTYDIDVPQSLEQALSSRVTMSRQLPKPRSSKGMPEELTGGSMFPEDSTGQDLSPGFRSRITISRHNSSGSATATAAPGSDRVSEGYDEDEGGSQHQEGTSSDSFTQPDFSRESQSTQDGGDQEDGEEASNARYSEANQKAKAALDRQLGLSIQKSGERTNFERAFNSMVTISKNNISAAASDSSKSPAPSEESQTPEDENSQDFPFNSRAALSKHLPSSLRGSFGAGGPKLPGLTISPIGGGKPKHSVIGQGPEESADSSKESFGSDPASAPQFDEGLDSNCSNPLEAADISKGSSSSPPLSSLSRILNSVSQPSSNTSDTIPKSASANSYGLIPDEKTIPNFPPMNIGNVSITPSSESVSKPTTSTSGGMLLGDEGQSGSGRGQNWPRGFDDNDWMSSQSVGQSKNSWMNYGTSSQDPSYQYYSNYYENSQQFPMGQNKTWGGNNSNNYQWNNSGNNWQQQQPQQGNSFRSQESAIPSSSYSSLKFGSAGAMVCPTGEEQQGSNSEFYPESQSFNFGTSSKSSKTNISQHPMPSSISPNPSKGSMLADGASPASSSFPSMTHSSSFSGSMEPSPTAKLPSMKMNLSSKQDPSPTGDSALDSIFDSARNPHSDFNSDFQNIFGSSRPSLPSSSTSSSSSSQPMGYPSTSYHPTSSGSQFYLPQQNNSFPFNYDANWGSYGSNLGQGNYPQQMQPQMSPYDQSHNPYMAPNPHGYPYHYPKQ